MWENVEKWWNNISAKRLKLFLVIDGIISVVVLLMSVWLSDIWLLITGDILILVLLLLCSEVKVKKENEMKKRKEEDKKTIIQNIFKGKSKIEVRLVRKYRYYPYYHEKSYDDLENLIFLHMLQFVEERKAFKCYAELCQDGQIVLYIITERKDNDITYKKEFAEFPQELFLEYFEPVEE